MNKPSHPCGCMQTKPSQTSNGLSQTDRYVSFAGIDCDGNAKRLIVLLRKHIDDPAHTNAFWERFKLRLAPESGPRHDELFLIHAHLNIMREYLEDRGDKEALTLLDKIEAECC